MSSKAQAHIFTDASLTAEPSKSREQDTMKNNNTAIALAICFMMNFLLPSCGGEEGVEVSEEDSFEDTTSLGTADDAKEQTDSSTSNSEPDSDELPVQEEEVALDPDRERASHDPILIDGNEDFAAQAAAEGWPGDGTQGDPYIIEGLEIDLEKQGKGAIDVRNTDVHFIIRDCYLHNGGQAWLNSNAQGYGIIARNVRNMRVERTIAVECFEGIWLKGTQDSVLHFNDVSHNSGHGISFESSHRNTVEYNLCRKERDDGILVGRGFGASDENIIRHNVFAENGTSGLNLSAGSRNVIYGNVFDEGNGMHVMAIVKNNTLYNEETGSGNWWHGHTSPDEDKDGIVDEPKKTSAGPDNYPLVTKPSTVPKR